MDLILLKKLQRYVKFIGLCPWYYDTTKTSFNYTYLVALIELLLMVMNVYAWLKLMGREAPIPYYIVQSCEIWTFIVFVLANYYAAVRLGSHWNSLLENCRKIDHILSQKGLEVITIKTHLPVILLFNTYYVIVFIMGFFDTRNITEKFSLIYTMEYIFQTSRKILMTVMTNLLTSILEKRYNFLAVLLKREFQSNRKDVKGALKEVERLMEVLMDCTDYVNVIIGGTSLTLIVHAFISTLSSFNSVSYLWEHSFVSSSIGVAILSYFGQRMFLCVLSFTIINGCDKVESAHYEILNVCNEFRSHVKHFTLRDEIILFYEYAKVLSPKFTALGFFRLRRALCLSFLSLLITYFIFVGQLYTA